MVCCRGKYRFGRVLLFALALWSFDEMLSQAVRGAPILFTGSSGTLSASVLFDQSGSDLVVTLSNTGTYDSKLPAEILTAVFFTLSGNPKLTPVSAVLWTNSLGTALSTIKGNGGLTDPGSAVGGEWAYGRNLNGAPLGAKQGVSSSGLNWFASNGLFPGSNLQGPTSPDGVQYGITTLNDTAGNDNGGLIGQGLIMNTVRFKLAGLPQGFVVDDANISDVSFQYGTAATEPNTPGKVIPEPTALALAATGLVIVALMRWPRGRSGSRRKDTRPNGSESEEGNSSLLPERVPIPQESFPLPASREMAVRVSEHQVRTSDNARPEH